MLLRLTSLLLLATAVAAGEPTITKVAPDAGTIGTLITVTIDGDIGPKPKVSLTPADPPPGAKVKALKLKLLDTIDLGGGVVQLQLSFKKAKDVGPHDLTVQPKNKNLPPLVMEDAFTINPPSVAMISPGTGAPKDLITVTGADFGLPKKPKVLFGDKKKGKVTILGPDSLLVKLPKLPDGIYDVTVANKIGEGTLMGALTIVNPNGGGGPGGNTTGVTVVHGFNAPTDGTLVMTGLLEAPDGTFYGTATQGGAVDSCGTVYKVTPGGAFTTLHDFTDAVDGCFPHAGLTFGADGNLYGVVANGGPFGLGAVFKLDLAGAAGDGETFSLVTTFGGPANPPSGPFGTLALGTDGALYGTTVAGGIDVVGGTVFKVTTAGEVTKLHEFEFGDGLGHQPTKGLLLAPDGNFYGTTSAGGDCPTCGTVFRISPAGDYELLHKFTGMDGQGPSSALALGGDGQLYGVTSLGGANGLGAIYKVSTAGMFTTVHSFNGDGFMTVPKGTLGLADDGNLYGTANVVFRLTPGDVVTPVYDFLALTLEQSVNGPALPAAGVIQGADGDLYGTSTGGGGPNNWGSVFKVDL